MKNQERTNVVCGVNLDWVIVCHPKNLGNVMKAKDCRFIGTKKECGLFVSEHRE